MSQVAGLDPQSLPVLVVDDEPDNLDAFRFNFKKSFRILTAQSGTEGLAILQKERVAVLVTDQRMPRMTGLEFLARARAISPDAVPIILTAYTDVDVLIEAINLGHVYRYITKPWDGKEMRGVLLQALERYHLRAENARLADQLREYAGYLNQEWHGAFNFGQLVGNSQVLKTALSRAEQVSRTHATVLLRGESGTGKELVAHAIHINSLREGKPFVRVNCAALASGVLESELFGHERGAFTGAVARKPGRFELADSGTLFLDEIGDLPMEVQVKLLRVLQERTFERVGGTETLRVDVRIISATHRNLEALVAEGKFREDLYYRLNVFPIVLPPLRERLDDVSVLCQHFLHKWRHHSSGRVIGIEPAALEMLTQYGFPGNVRELENLIERALILANGPEIRVSDLEFSRPQNKRPGAPLAPSAPSVSAFAPAAASISGQGRSAEPISSPLPAPAAAPIMPSAISASGPQTLGSESSAATGSSASASAGASASSGAAATTTAATAGTGSGPISLPGTQPAAGPISGSPGGRSLADRLHDQERTEILAAIEHSEGNIAAAARQLGINRSTLYYRLRKHDLLHLLPSRPPDAET